VECTLQLPDPERKLSRVHVELSATGGGYRLKVASTHSSVVVNGRDYPPGSEVTLRAGDALVMDVYDLDVVSVGTPVGGPVAMARAPAPQVLVAEPTAQTVALARPAGPRARLAKRLGVAAAAIAGVLVVLAFWPHSAGRIKDLAYSVKPDGRVYFEGTYGSEPFAFLHTSATNGAGRSVLFLGAKPDRLRATFTGRKHLVEILAIDKGLRITLIAVDGKRMEYRLYGPDRRFLSGSVLYRAKGRWWHGLLKAEAFAGYEALVNVTDFTEAIARQKLSLQDQGRERAFLAWEIGLVSSARAQDADPEDHLREDFNKVYEGMLETMVRTGLEAQIAQFELTRGIGGSLEGLSDPLGFFNSELNQGLAEQIFQYLQKFLPKIETTRSLADELLEQLNDEGKIKKDHSILGKLEDDIAGFQFTDLNLSADGNAWNPVGGGGGMFDYLSGSASSPSAPPSTADTSASGTTPPAQRRKQFDTSAKEVGRCIRANDLACADAAVADLKRNASPEDAEIVALMTNSVSRAKAEVADAARSSDEAVRQSLLARDRQTAEAAAAATQEIARKDAERRASVPPPRPVQARQEPAQDNSVLEAEERRKVIADFQRTLLDKQTVQQANEETRRSRQGRSPFGMDGGLGFNVPQELARLSQEEQSANAALNASAARLQKGAAAAPTSGNCSVATFSDQLLGAAIPGDIQCMTQYENAESTRQQAIANCRAGDPKSANTIYRDRYIAILVPLVKSQCRPSSASTSVPAQGRAPTAPPAKPANRPVTAPAVKPCVSDGHFTCVRPI
jgi:hypothetical protein